MPIKLTKNNKNKETRAAEVFPSFDLLKFFSPDAFYKNSFKLRYLKASFSNFASGNRSWPNPALPRVFFFTRKGRLFLDNTFPIGCI